MIIRLVLLLLLGLHEAAAAAASLNDGNANVFSPEGTLLQLDYAAGLVRSDALCLGLRCRDGVVLASPRRSAGSDSAHPAVSLLSSTHPSGRMYRVDEGLGVLCAGLRADGRALAAVAGDYALAYRRLYGEAMPARLLAEQIGAHMHATSITWGQRSYPNALIIAGFGDDVVAEDTVEEGAVGQGAPLSAPLGEVSTDDGPQLYMVQPNGMAYSFKACCTGSGSEAVLSRLKDWDPSRVSCSEALELIGALAATAEGDDNDATTETESAAASEGRGAEGGAEAAAGEQGAVSFASLLASKAVEVGWVAEDSSKAESGKRWRTLV